VRSCVWWYRCLCLCLALVAVGARAEEPAESEEAVRTEVLKQCRTFTAFSEAKLEHIRLALTRGKKAEAQELAGKLKAEESRALERIIWALQPNRSLRERVDFLKERLEKTSQQSAEDFLKEKETQNFAVPRCLCNPYAKDVEGVAPPTHPSAGVSAAPGSSSPSPAASPSK
jgi:hypothetical protein